MSPEHRPASGLAKEMATTSFYVTGGTLRSDALSYVERQADRDLYQGLSRGEFCCVLTARRQVMLQWPPLATALGYHVYRGPADARPSQLRRLTVRPLATTAY